MEEESLKKLRLRERRYEIDQLMKVKRSEDMETLEEVFDKQTLMTIYKMLNKGLIARIFGVVKAGKEARIYWAKGQGGEDIAVKIYLTSTAEFRKGRLKYIEGDPRFKAVKRSTRALVSLWAQKEFKNLELAHSVGVRVPKPIHVEGNVLLMEFIGDGGVPAPLLKDVPLRAPMRVYKKLIAYMKALYRDAGLVHGDMSEYNVMIWKGEPIIFDLSQAVPKEHPMSESFLRRDISVLNNYFRREYLLELDDEEVFKRIVV
ncbi:MAG: serine protein kinase RIO [Candidatus Bathyarchaeia archaeon]